MNSMPAPARAEISPPMSGHIYCAPTADGGAFRLAVIADTEHACQASIDHALDQIGAARGIGAFGAPAPGAGGWLAVGHAITPDLINPISVPSPIDVGR